MALKHGQRGGRAAFTLIELLVVIGLMAMLATLSVAGYGAASRGMADRGVIQNTAATLRIAQQTCQLERVPTKVLFFNQRLLRDKHDESSEVYQGTAIAIKQAGRISIDPRAVGGLLVDEFADWHQSYPMAGSENSPGMRFYRMRLTDQQSDFEKCSALVQPFVTHYPMGDYMIQAGTRIDYWCTEHRKTANDNRSPNAPSSYVPNGNNYVWGFKVSTAGGSSGLDGTSWHAGDPYGVEIARFDLPVGYIFGTKAPSDNKLEAASVKEVSFDPHELSPRPSHEPEVSAMRPNASGRLVPKKVDTVTERMLRDDTNN